MLVKELILVAFLAITLSVEANPDESAGNAHGVSNSARRNNRHRELLKPETNAIDHGPNNHHKSDHLLGHRGEQHWGLKKNKKRNMMRKYKKKANHSSGSHHDSLDDIRLQDLSYVPPKSKTTAPTTLKKTHKNNKKELKAIHNKNYLKKLKMWKAKMMSKKNNKNKKNSNNHLHP